MGKKKDRKDRNRREDEGRQNENAGLSGEERAGKERAENEQARADAERGRGGPSDRDSESPSAEQLSARANAEPQETEPRDKEAGQKPEGADGEGHDGAAATGRADAGDQGRSGTGAGDKDQPAAADKAGAKDRQKPALLYVALGASAGGLESLKAFFENVEPDGGMAYIVVTHQDPSHASQLPDLLGNITSIPVNQVTDGTEVKPDNVYTIPPDRDMTIEDGVLKLSKQQQHHGLRAPITHFFRSLARDQGERAVCVLLSGMGTDGTPGMKDIKERLGMAMAQDPDTAKFSSMPRSAVSTGMVDFVLPVEEMPERLRVYRSQMDQTGARERELPDHDLGKVFTVLRRITGHDFSSYKRNTIIRRVERRMNLMQIEELSAYIKKLQEDRGEVNVLFKDLLIGVTSFFREPEAWEVLKNEALPEYLAERADGENLRIWVAGCASGEEAYTMAITISEYLEKHNQHYEVQIFATDLDPDSIEKAREGVYPAGIASDVSKKRLDRYFVKDGDFFRVKREIREMLVFAEQNVIKDPPFTRLDLVCCRNLLIYLESEVQEKLLPMFHYALRPEGLLMLGSSETVGRFMNLFTAVTNKWRLYRARRVYLDRGNLEFPVGGGEEHPARLEKKPKEAEDLRSLVEAELLQHVTPACVVVDAEGDIQYIHGRTSRFLEPAEGRAQMNVLEMARGGLDLKLPLALRKVVKDGREYSSPNVQVILNGDTIWVDVTARPLRDTDGLVMLLFREVEAEHLRGMTEDVLQGASEQELVEELRRTKADLQSAMEEAQTRNEELRSANEEYQSTNEELQSANEELETSKEEMQSLNEELVTVNNELQNKVEDLTRAHRATQNLLDNLEVPIVLVDTGLNIKQFTSRITGILKLRTTDVGRPLSEVVTSLQNVNLEEEAREVLDTLDRSAREVTDKEGHRYFMKVKPFRSERDTIDGVIISLTDLQELEQMRQKYEEAAEKLDIEKVRAGFLQSVFDTIRESLLLLDRDLKVAMANQSFYSAFGLDPGRTEGTMVDDLGDGAFAQARLNRLLKKVLSQQASFDDYHIDMELGDGQRSLLLNARLLRFGDGDKRQPYVLLALEDITDRPEMAQRDRDEDAGGGSGEQAGAQDAQGAEDGEGDTGSGREGGQ
jgi:two-component system CheB/CheR fusion protein